MRARLAKKILKAKIDYQSFIRLDFPYTGPQVYAAAKRAGIPIRYRNEFYSRWRKVTKVQGRRTINALLCSKGKIDKVKGGEK